MPHIYKDSDALALMANEDWIKTQARIIQREVLNEVLGEHRRDFEAAKSNGETLRIVGISVEAMRELFMRGAKRALEA